MRKKNYWHLLTILLVSVLFAGVTACSSDDDGDKKAKTGKIVGLVSDYASANTPIAGATVTLVQQGEAKVTGVDGRFEFDNLKPGSYTVAVAANNFQVTTQMAYVTEGETSHCDFQLQRSSQNVEITPMSLTFGKNTNQLSFYIVNNTNQLLTYSFSNVPDYLQISPSAGTVAAKGRQAVIASIPNRTTVTTAETQIVIVNIGSDSYALMVTLTNSNVTNPENTDPENPDPDPQPATGNVTRGLLAYYNFDDETADNSYGTQNNGVLMGAAQFISDTPNGSGKALYLDQEQYVNIARNPISGKASYTISMWVKDFGSGFLFSASSYYDPNNIYIMGDGKISLDYESRYSFKYDSRSLQTSGWHMLTIIRQEQEGIVELYVDGKLVDNQTSFYKPDGNIMQIGGRGNPAYQTWADPFKVDNVRVYGVSLTEDEVAQLYKYEK